MAAAKGSAPAKPAGSGSWLDDWVWYIGGAAALGVGIGLTVYAYQSDKKKEKQNEKLRYETSNHFLC